MAGMADTVLSVYIALSFAARFRDAGWPGWLGASLMLFFSLVLPWSAVLGVMMFAEQLRTTPGWDSTSVLNIAGYGALIGGGTLTLLAGCVPARM